MPKLKHPKSKFERLVNEQKKAQARERGKARDPWTRLAKETLTIQEIEDGFEREDRQR